MTSTPSDGGRQARLETLFHGALERPVAQRADWLRDEAGADATLVAEVEELLGALGGAPTCLDKPAWGLADALPARAAEVSPVGSSIGPYVIERLLGEGGMGEVWLARQTSPVVRRVALKRIKLGMDTQEVVRRFASERKAVARLNHPNIASVHDAGVTARGRPYFVMEYVPGERLTEACDRRRLSLQARLELFVQVCDAVQHAHQHGIIHRDLKPSNVLVTRIDGQLVPKVIDFGVAKATQAGRGKRTVATRNGQLIGTPGYMSPEQARAEAIDTRSDVYALGVLLYELVAGVLPHDPATWRGLADDQLQRLVGRLEAPRPSTRLAELGPVRLRALALRRRVEPRGLLRKLRGDLDWISMRALELDRDRRYASVSELAADIVAHLRDEPVSAGPPSATYRLRKLAVRHRRPAMAAGVALLALGGGAAGLLGWLASSRQDLQHELGDVSAALESTRAVEADARADRDALVAACDTAAEHAGEALPYTTLLARNTTRSPLQPGTLVEFVSRGEDGPFGSVVHVSPARVGSGRVVLGVVTSGAQAAADGAHVHRLAGAVAPGGLGHVAVSGPLVPVSVVGPVQVRDALAPSGIPGVAERLDDQREQLGRAMESHDGPGAGVVMAMVAPGPAQVTSPGTAAAELVWMPNDPVAPQTAQQAPAARGAGALDGVAAAHGAGASGLADTNQPDLLVLGTTAGPIPVPVVVIGGGGGGGQPATPLDDSNVGTGGGPGPNGGGPSTPHGINSDIGLTGTAWEDGLLSAGGPPSPNAPGELGTVGDVLDLREDRGKSTPPMGTGGDNTVDSGTGDNKLDGHGSGLGTGGGGEDGDAEPRWLDVDDDGLVDVLLPTDSGLSLLRNAGQGLFVDQAGRSNLSAIGQVASFDALDVDGDGSLDIAALSRTGRFQLLRGDGRASWSPFVLPFELDALGEIVSFGLLDLDGDERPDVRLTSRAGGLYALLHSGAGVFQLAVVHAPDSGVEESAPPKPVVPPAAPPTSLPPTGQGPSLGGSDLPAADPTR